MKIRKMENAFQRDILQNTFACESVCTFLDVKDMISLAASTKESTLYKNWYCFIRVRLKKIVLVTCDFRTRLKSIQQVREDAIHYSALKKSQFFKNIIFTHSLLPADVSQLEPILTQYEDLYKLLETIVYEYIINADIHIRIRTDDFLAPRALFVVGKTFLPEVKINIPTYCSRDGRVEAKRLLAEMIEKAESTYSSCMTNRSLFLFFDTSADDAILQSTAFFYSINITQGRTFLDTLNKKPGKQQPAHRIFW
jgi:hypothetical protein